MNLLLEIADEGIVVGEFHCQDGIGLVLGDADISLIEMCPGVAPSSGGVSSHDYEEFIATAAQTLYQLIRVPASGVLVFINGLLESETEYAVTGSQLLFNSGAGITAGDKVGIFYFY